MTTNGYLLNAAMLNRMLRCSVLHYQITLDGLSDTHNAARTLASGGPTFETILDNLREIRDTVSSRLFKISIRTNVTKPQLAKIDEYAAFLNAEFADDDQFEFFFRPAGNWGGERVKNIERDFVDSDKDFYEPLLNSAAPLNVNAYISLLNTLSCGAAKRNSFVLGSDGALYKCTMLFNEDFNTIGALTRSGDLEIDAYKIARWTAIPANPPQKCAGCGQWTLCHDNTCPAKSLEKKNREHKNCGYERTSLNYVLSLLDTHNSRYLKAYQ
jgi:uncharacterized protein